MRQRLEYFGAFLAEQGPLATAGWLCITTATSYFWGTLLAGWTSSVTVLGALLGTAAITAQIIAWWPPLCPCGVRHWDEGDDEDDDSDEYGMAA